ncbi:MAG: hypothetical protein HOP12_15185, partial [Candidatus Eisenbacteria bacterium]|nr:hypothetical protein [Candidatus Eisenbacteria bacterium]
SHDDGGAVPTPAPARVGAPALGDRGAAALAGPRRYYLANDDHTDYEWSGSSAFYRGAFGRMLDYYMTQAETTASYPSDSRGRFNTDGSVWVSEYEVSRTPADFQRLIGHLRAGSITMPLNTCVQLYGAMPAEAVIRSFAYAGRLERRENLRFRLVIPMENQTLPGGVASLWAGCGARYSWKGICDCSSQINAWDRSRDVYHFTGKDGQSVLMKWNSMLSPGSSQVLGGYAEARNPIASLNTMRTDPEFLTRWPYDVAGAFGYGWDDAESTTNAFVQASLTQSNANERVIVSNQIDFFEDFEANYGSTLNSFGASFGNEWDLRTAGLAEVTARARRALEKLRTAEALVTLVALHDPSILAGRAADRDSAMMCLGLYYEHSWEGGPSVSESQRVTWQRRIESMITRYVNALHTAALVRLGELVKNDSGAERHVVFNPLSWVRDDAVDLTPSTAAPRHVVDVTTGLQVPSQEIVVDGVPRLRVLASAVPAVGYRTYEVRAGAGTTFTPAATFASATLDNGRYAVTLGSRGQITSLVDHADANRELVASGQALHDFGTGNGSVALESSGAVSATIRVSAGGSPAHETRVTLYRGIDRVAVEGRVTQNFGDTRTYRSTFALGGATMRHEEVGMIARVARQSQGGDYADEDARTDYLTFNHFVDLSLPARGVTVSNWDSPYFQAGNSTITTLDAATPRIDAVVGMQIDGSGGISNQGGDTAFLNRYAFRAHGAWDPAAAMRFSLEHQNPLVAAPVLGALGSPYPDTTFSLIQISDPNLLLWALKPVEEGIAQGVIARVWNLADSPRALRLDVAPQGIAVASRVTHIETPIGPAVVLGGGIEDSLATQQMKSYRFIAQPSVTESSGTRTHLALAAWPNPLARAAVTHLRFSLGAATPVRVSVHDVAGREIARLADRVMLAGTQTLDWDGRDRDGRAVAAGLYLVKARIGTRIETARVVRF